MDDKDEVVSRSTLFVGRIVGFITRIMATVIILIVITSVCCIGSWFWAMGYYNRSSYLQEQIKDELSHNGGLDALKKFSDKYIGKSVDETFSQILTQGNEKFPYRFSQFLYDKDRIICAVEFKWGGGMHEYGLFIGSLNDIERSESGVMPHWLSQQWDENIFYYDDASPDLYRARHQRKPLPSLRSKDAGWLD